MSNRQSVTSYRPFDSNRVLSVYFTRLKIAGKVVAPKHVGSSGWVDPRISQHSSDRHGECKSLSLSLSLSPTILRLFLTMKCGLLVFLAASCRARERIVAVDFTELTYPRICVTHTGAPLNPGICLTERLIGDCGRDEARWGTLSKTMAASARWSYHPRLVGVKHTLWKFVL